MNLTNRGMKMKPKIAIVDDEPDIRDLVLMTLEKNGFDALAFQDGKTFYQFIEEHPVDLIILDLMLPDVDGMEICKYLRSMEKTRDIPIIMLTAKSQEVDKILGLEIGADDYVTKPFSPRELVARVKSVLRRTGVQKKSVKLLRVGEHITIDEEKYEIRIDDQPVYFTATEFKIFQLLASSPGKVYSRDVLLDFLWGNDKFVIDRTIDVHVRHIRKKLGEYGHIIKSVKGIGYKLDLSI